MDREVTRQRAFANYIMSGDRKIGASIDERYVDRLSVYRNNFLLNGEETLSQVFPVTRMILGRRRFFETSTDYVQNVAASEPNREAWGDNFPPFLEQKVNEHGLAFLSDLAKFELLLFHAGKSESARSIEIDEIGFSNVMEFELLPSVRLFQSSYRVDELYELHASGKIHEMEKVSVEKALTFLMIFQKSASPVYSSVDQEFFDFLTLFKSKGWHEETLAPMGSERLIGHLRRSLGMGIVRLGGSKE